MIQNATSPHNHTALDTNGTIDVVSCCDDNYARHCAVVMASTLDNTVLPSRLRFWIVSAAPLESHVSEQLRKIAERAKARIEFVTTSTEALACAPVSGHISAAAYLRILLPYLLPPDLDKVIYLDCDVVVRSDLAEFLALPLSENQLVGAIENPRFDNWASLGMEPSMGYFNSGVMLLNLAEWRRTDLPAVTLKYIAGNSAALKFWDQDALNSVIAGRWLHIDPRWNQQYTFYLWPATTFGFTKEEHARLLTDPWIVHYSGGSKPWFFADDHPFKRLYYHYLDRTPFRGWRPKPKEPKDWARKLGRYVIPNRWRPAVFGW